MSFPTILRILGAPEPILLLCDANIWALKQCTVLIPFFDKSREHWLLLSVDTSRARVDVYDSLPSQILKEVAIYDLPINLYNLPRQLRRLDNI